jgi:hypothetical protein
MLHPEPSPRDVALGGASDDPHVPDAPPSLPDPNLQFAAICFSVLAVLLPVTVLFAVLTWLLF